VALSYKKRKWCNIFVVHGDVNWSSLEFKHALERSGLYGHTNVVVPNIGEEFEFPLN